MTQDAKEFRSTYLSGIKFAICQHIIDRAESEHWKVQEFVLSLIEEIRSAKFILESDDGDGTKNIQVG